MSKLTKKEKQFFVSTLIVLFVVGFVLIYIFQKDWWGLLADTLKWLFIIPATTLMLFLLTKYLKIEIYRR